MAKKPENIEPIDDSLENVVGTIFPELCPKVGDGVIRRRF